MNNLEKELKYTLHHKILEIINNMISKNLDIKNIKNYFKHKNNFNHILNDIKWFGIEMLNNDKSRYTEICKELLNDILEDKDAILKDNKVLKFKDFKKK